MINNGGVYNAVMEYPQFIGLNFVVYLISLCRTDVLSSENLKKRFLVCKTAITITSRGGSAAKHES